MLLSQSHRREFLRQSAAGAGGLMLTPFAQPLQAAPAVDAATKPKRFVFVTISNGMGAGPLQPEGIVRDGKTNSRLVEQPLADQKLPTVLEPLEFLKNRLTIVQGLSGRIASGGHFTQHGALGCYSSKVGAFAETIDLALAKTRNTIFPHIGLGVVTGDTPVAYGRSASGREQPCPSICQPKLAYDQLFATVAQGDARQALVARNNLIDFLARDLKKLDAKLDGEERKRLDVHAQGYQAMIDRVGRLDGVKETLRKHAPALNAKYESACPMERLAAQFDVGAAALTSGLTDVLTISSGVGGAWNMSFRSLGIGIGSHTLHHGGQDNNRNSGELAAIVRRYHAEQIAGLAKKLQATPEGKGTMLDNTVIVFTSDNGYGHHSDCKEWPLAIVGNLGGKLKTDGRYLQYPLHGTPGNRTMANLYLTLLDAAGAPRATFGVADPNMDPKDQKGPLKELLA